MKRSCQGFCMMTTNCVTLNISEQRYSFEQIAFPKVTNSQLQQLEKQR